MIIDWNGKNFTIKEEYQGDPSLVIAFANEREMDNKFRVDNYRVQFVYQSTFLIYKEALSPKDGMIELESIPYACQYYNINIKIPEEELRRFIIDPQNWQWLWTKVMDFCKKENINYLYTIEGMTIVHQDRFERECRIGIRGCSGEYGIHHPKIIFGKQIKEKKIKAILE